MRFPADIRTRLEGAWSRHWTDWIGGQGSWPLRVSLGSPNQSEAISSWEYVCLWRTAWTDTKVSLDIVSRRWQNLGTQPIPTHAMFASAAEVAAFLGGNKPIRLASAEQRWRTLGERWPEVILPRKVVPWLADAPQTDIDLACNVAEWFRDNNSTTDLYVRQVPIPGVDSKWLEGRRDTVAALLSALRGEDSPGCSHAVLGLRQDKPRCRVRLLDPGLRAVVGGLGDLSAPVEDLSALTLGAKNAVIIENLQTFLACGDLPGTIAFFGSGFQAPLLGSVRWLHRIPVLYWGDIDTAGFEILNGLRATLPKVASFGMDETTLLTHRHLWVHDSKQRSSKLPLLTQEETSVHQGLLDGRHGVLGIRLEQERLDWASLWHRLETEVERPSSHRF